MKQMLLATLLIGLAMIWPGAAAAVDSCSVSATSVAFGAYNPLSGTDVPSTGTITVTCTNNGFIVVFPETVALTIGLSAGGSGSTSPRKLDQLGGPDTLNYNLYTGSARNKIWGKGSRARSGSLTVPPCFFCGGSSESKTFTVYGLLFGGQLVSAGSYSDTIVVTVIFN